MPVDTRLIRGATVAGLAAFGTAGRAADAVGRARAMTTVEALLSQTATRNTVLVLRADEKS